VRRILSGLVAPQSPLDLFSQFQFLDPRILGFTSFYAFRARYAILKRQVFGGRAFDMVVGYRDEDELAERIAPHSYRVRLEDCHDVMDDLYVTREVELTPEQRRAYSELKEFATTALSAEVHVTATIALTQVLRLHQVLCGHVKDESGQVHEVPENRTKELVALLEDYDGKAIVWCSYDADVRRVVSVLEREHGKGSVARFWGGNIATREDEERQFLSDPNCRFMVATPSAGGKGRTWLVADLVVYYSNTSNLEHRLQSEERPKGVGKSTPITYVDLIAPGTVDGKILKALRAKIDVASTLQGDGWREWVV
jgi:SNF2 family DNA or RNA helicase